ncbi:ankyrin [Aspergillus sclerotioniger CBS 115572]|uniref:Ankyrin n=1 Tax=Aspergillus sclerotioniger CBS 115572 TaxID=1450535 RepID=A0A317WTH9_9EURO|nr:ankyrin [Aspergillus sclerotioniger CBS 115572]PWY89713.1 ankyrin [Aspergillus sclerotioniger CBS 115572]
MYVGNLEILKLLLDHPGSDIPQGVMKLPLLCYAAYRGEESVVKLLIDRGASLQATDERYERNALIWAVVRGHRAAFSQLLQTPGIGWDDPDRMGRTALFYAARENHEDIFRELTSRGSHVHCPDRFGLTVLVVAVQHGHENLVRAILESHPLTQEPRDRYGRTLSWWIQSTGNDWLRDIVARYGMQLGDLGQEGQDLTYCYTESNTSSKPCDICTLPLALHKREIECGSGSRKYRICHVCCEFGATCKDFAE